MIDFETDLRTVFAERADGAPPISDLYPGIARRSRRRTRRRRALVAGCASVALVGAGIVGSTTVFGNDRDKAGLTAAAPDPRRVALVPIDLERVPDGFKKPTAVLTRPGVWALKSVRDEPWTWLEVHVTTERPEANKGPGTTRTLDLDGVPATFYTVVTPKTGPVPSHPDGTPVDGALGELVFQRKPGQWIRILSQDTMLDQGRPLTERQFRDVAAAIVDRERPVEMPMTFATVPDGLEFAHVDFGRGEVSLSKPGTRYAPDMPDPSRSLLVGVAGVSLKVEPLFPSEFNGGDPGEPVSSKRIPVGNRTGVFVAEPDADSDQTVLVVSIEGGRYLVVAADRKSGLSKEDLVSFAAGVKVAEDAGRD